MLYAIQNLTLHYLTDGSCMLQFSKNKEMFFVPVVYVLKVIMKELIIESHNSNELYI